MAKFSSRYGYDPKGSGPARIEEASEWLRNNYWSLAIAELLYIDKDKRYSNAEEVPLPTKELGEQFCRRILREEPERAMSDSWHCMEELQRLITTAKWYHFYDFVELVGERLREAERRRDAAWKAKFGFGTYQKKVNSLLAEDRVAWTLSSKGEFLRDVPAEYTSAMNEVEAALKGELEPARDHYGKAFRFIYERPLDPENGIKEIVSAVESLGKIIYPGTKSLGDVVKKLRADEAAPQGIVTLIDKFYGFANAEPAVRHGGAVSSSVSIHDAEFCFLVGVGLIRYLLRTRAGART